MSRPVIKTIAKDNEPKLTAWVTESKKEDAKIPFFFKGTLAMDEKEYQVIGYPVANNDGKNPDISWKIDKGYYEYKKMETPQLPDNITSWINHGNITTAIGKKDDNQIKIRSGFDILETAPFKALDMGKTPLVVCLSEDNKTKVALWSVGREDGKTFLSGKIQEEGKDDIKVTGNFLKPEKGSSATALINKKDSEDKPMPLWINDLGSATVKIGEQDLKGGVHPVQFAEVVEELRENIEAKREMKKAERGASATEAPEDEQIFTPEPDNDTSHTPF